MTIANIAVTFFLLGATLVLTPFTFALAMGWIGENGERETYKRYKRYTRQEPPGDGPVPGKAA